ncbi:cytochrome-c peroxidase [Rubrivivax albus]|uniref:Cytochrome C peroxidase n=1 Tax=Rubrivivax albus TaxID=2499835 RepID=A0A437JP08_9BURK|nr:cytochrome c peroxidase [Rubrivivax albus]RVT48513.1 cytochrome C peroxidase [Rubrivivax albus]
MPARFLAWASARLRRDLTAALLALQACTAWAATPAVDAYRFTAADRAFLATLTLDRLPPPPPSPSNAWADDPRAAQLGQRLFFDPALSDSGRFACASCHQPARHFTDGLPRAVAAGTARRHTPSLLGAAHGPWLNWDGSADSLWAQALGPIEHADEMATPRSRWVGRVLQTQGAALAAVFGPVPDLPEAAVLARPMSPLGDAAAQAAWQALPSTQRDAIDRVFAQTGKALAAYQRRLKMAPARFDRFVQALQRDDDAAARQQMAPDEVAGLRLFVGAARCVSCHNGPLFTNHEFHNIGAPEPDRSRVDLGRADGVQRLQAGTFSCLSPHSDANAERDCGEMRFLKTQGPELVGAFKTPSLRNVAATAPYMQAGQLATLADVLAHYNQPQPPFYDPAQHPSRPHFDILPLQLTPSQLGQLAAFLGTLTSPLPTDAPWWQAPPPPTATPTRP